MSRSSLLRLTATAGLCLLTAACAATADEPVTPVKTALNNPADTNADDAIAPAPKPKPDIPLPTLASLFGAGPAALDDLLGPPALLRIEPPAQLWQYQGGACVLALFLYEKTKGGPVSLTHAEAHDGKGKSVETETCLHALLREKG